MSDKALRNPNALNRNYRRELWCDIEVANRGETYVLTIVEKAAMNQQVEFTAAELAKALQDKGSIALHNILFDTGKAQNRRVELVKK